MRILFLLLFFTSCAYKTIPLKGTYSDGTFEAYTDTPKDKVWENIIEFFAKNGLSIRIIDRSSGLIISGETAMTWTFENSKGQLEKKDAWIVIQKVINPGNKMPITPYSVTGEWNIRIKEDEGRTLININLVNPAFNLYGSTVKTAFAKGSFQSTEVFERSIYNTIK